MGRGGQNQTPKQTKRRAVNDLTKDSGKAFQTLTDPFKALEPEAAKEHLLGHLKQGEIFQKHTLRRHIFSNLVSEHINRAKGIDHTVFALREPADTAEHLIDAMRQQALTLDSPSLESGVSLLEDDQRYLIELTKALRDPAAYPEADPDDYSEFYEEADISDSERARARAQLKALIMINKDYDLGPVYQPLLKAARGEDTSEDAPALAQFLRDFETEFQTNYPHSGDGHLSDIDDAELNNWCQEMINEGGDQLKKLAQM
jgi:hypothetical protein